MLAWLQDFVTPENIWDIVPPVALGGGAVIGVIKKFRDAWAMPAIYGVAGSGIIFVCGLLYVQSERHIESVRQLGIEQKGALEKISDEQKATLGKLAEVLEKYADVQNASLEKLTEALDKSADEQRATLNKLANTRPIRPYFTLARGVIRHASKVINSLKVSVQNNEIVAENVISHLLVLEEPLSSNTVPLHSSRIENANPVGLKAILSHKWEPKSFKPSARPIFVVFQVQYTNPLSNKIHSQPLFLKFPILSQSGTHTQELSSASSDEKRRIERYMEKRGISKL